MMIYHISKSYFGENFNCSSKLPFEIFGLLIINYVNISILLKVSRFHHRNKISMHNYVEDNLDYQNIYARSLKMSVICVFIWKLETYILALVLLSNLYIRALFTFS